MVGLRTFLFPDTIFIYYTLAKCCEPISFHAHIFLTVLPWYNTWCTYIVVPQLGRFCMIILMNDLITVDIFIRNNMYWCQLICHILKVTIYTLYSWTIMYPFLQFRRTKNLLHMRPSFMPFSNDRWCAWTENTHS